MNPCDFSQFVRPYSEVQHRDHGGWHIYTINGSRTKLLFFGCHHVWIPGHPMFGEIERHFEQWQPDLVFVEGIDALRRIEYSSGDPSAETSGATGLSGVALEEARAYHLRRRQEVLDYIAGEPLETLISKGGEPLFTTRLALQRGIPVECPEPTFKQQVKAVCAEGFSREAIAAFFILRMFGGTKASLDPSKLETILGPWINELREATAWADFDYSLKNLSAIGWHFWGQEPFRPGDYEFYRMRVAPIDSRIDKDGTEINQVSSFCSLTRDHHILSQILSAQDRASRMMVVYGSGHAFTLEEALRKGLNAAANTQ